MPDIGRFLFGKTRILQEQIGEFLDKISEGGLIFERALRAHLDGETDVVQEKMKQLTEAESRADSLRRMIETTLYTEMLLPESRGDVLDLLHDLDTLLDDFKASILGLVVERPVIPEQHHKGIMELASVVVTGCEHTVQAARAFFRDAPSIRDHIHKIRHFEQEADDITLRLRQAIFDSDLPLAQKIHLREVIHFISGIADIAEDCGDHLTIYSIKRSL